MLQRKKPRWLFEMVSLVQFGTKPHWMKQYKKCQLLLLINLLEADAIIIFIFSGSLDLSKCLLYFLQVLFQYKLLLIIIIIKCYSFRETSVHYKWFCKHFEYMYVESIFVHSVMLLISCILFRYFEYLLCEEMHCLLAWGTTGYVKYWNIKKDCYCELC